MTSLESGKFQRNLRLINMFNEPGNTGPNQPIAHIHAGQGIYNFSTRQLRRVGHGGPAAAELHSRQTHHLVVDDQCEDVFILVLLYNKLSGIRISITLQGERRE